jgi:cell division septation protein DedD
MLDPKKIKPLAGPGKLTSEFTSSQLVIAICMFLLMALICFSLGVLVGKGERAKQAQVLQTTLKPDVSLPPAPRTEAAKPAEEGVQRSPRPVVMPPPEPAKAVATPEAETPARPPAAPETPAAPPAAAPGPGAKPAEPQPPESKPAEGKIPDTKTAKGAYSIQVASFSGPNRKTNAGEYKRRLEAHSEFKAELVGSEDDKMVRVMIGSYPDREAASKACEELKQRAGFAGSFPKRR